jgi:Domain of unknown function (DUF4193)
MSDDEFDDEPDLDEEDLDDDVVVEEEFDDALLGDDDDDDVVDPLVDAEGVVIPPIVGLVPVPVEPVVEDDEEDDVVDLDEELHPDDVEEALDVVLRERTVAAGLEGDEEDDEPDEPGEAGTKIVPRRENEFLCRSCFLVLPRHQLADEKRMICRDCA